MKRLFVLLLSWISLCCYAQNELHFTGLLPDDGQYDLLPRKADLRKADYDGVPSRHSLRMFCPEPQSQGPYGTCVGWSTGYAARTIAEAIKYGWFSQKKINEEAFSPLFVYVLATDDKDDDECTTGAHVYKALKLMKNVGAVKRSAFDVKCASYVSRDLIEMAAEHKIDDFFTLFSSWWTRGNEKIAKVKKSISENHPVIVSMKMPRSFHYAGRHWSGEVTDSHRGLHAMCVVGYDDNENGGSFQIMNSWGTRWGDNGFTWVKYSDFKEYVYQAYEIYVKRLPPVQPGNNIDLRHKNNGGKKNESIIKPQFKLNRNLLSGTVAIQLASGEEAGSTYNSDKRLYRLEQNIDRNQGFRLNVSNDAPSYVYVIGWMAGDSVVRLFPPADSISAALTYKSNHIAIPSEDDYLKPEVADGIRNICVLYSSESLDFNQVIDSINTSKGTFAKRLETVIGNRMTPTANLDFLSNQMGCKTESDKTIMPVMIELPRRH